MGVTVRWLDLNMTYKELVHWSAYYELEPWGSQPEWLRLGVMTSSIVNVISIMRAAIVAALTGKRKKPKMVKPKDFIPEFGPKKKQSSATMLKIVEMLNEAYKGKDLRQKDGQG